MVGPRDTPAWDGTAWAVVAGGSGGVGSAVVRRLVADGANVLFTYRKSANVAASLVTELAGSGREIESVRVDLTDAAATGSIFDRFHGGQPLGAVVYAAGPYFRMDYIARTTPDELAFQLAADTQACFNFVQPALPYLRARPGCVLAVSTPAVRRYPKRDFLSSLPKAAIEALIRGVAVEEGRYGVRANCVGVGMIQAGLWDALHANGDYTEAALEIAQSNIPLTRFGTADDIANAVSFLVSEQAAWVTGQTLYVDGGYSV